MLSVKRLEMRRKPCDLIENYLLLRHEHVDGRLELSSHKLGFCNSDNEIPRKILAIAVSFQLTEIHDLQTKENNLLDIVLLIHLKCCSIFSFLCSVCRPLFLPFSFFYWSLFQWTSSMKIQLSMLVQYKAELIVISLKINLFSP